MKLWCPIIGLMLASPTVAQQQPAGPLEMLSAAGRISTLEELDQALKDLRRLPWMIAELATALPTPMPAEPGGRRMEDDLAQYVLTEPSLKALTDLRDSIAAQGGTSISESAIQPVMALMEAETCRAGIITSYWERRRVRSVHAALVEQVIGYMNEADRADATSRLEAVNARGDAMRSTLVDGVGKCRSRESFRDMALEGGKAADQLLKEYEDLRNSLLSSPGTARRAGAAMPVATRVAACPAPAPPRTGNAPAAMRRAPDVSDYYPADARQNLIGGVVRVGLRYDSTGCVVEANVAESSGSADLDKAAVQFGLNVALSPAVVDGEPQTDYVILPVRFSVRH